MGSGRQGRGAPRAGSAPLAPPPPPPPRAPRRSRSLGTRAAALFPGHDSELDRRGGGGSGVALRSLGASSRRGVGSGDGAPTARADARGHSRVRHHRRRHRWSLASFPGQPPEQQRTIRRILFTTWCTWTRRKSRASNTPVLPPTATTVCPLTPTDRVFRRIPLLRTPVNKAREGRGWYAPALSALETLL